MLVSTIATLIAIQMYGGRGGTGYMHGWGWGFGILAALFWLAVLVLVCVLIWRLLADRRRDGTGRESPMEILERRYARGEIDRQEFEEKKRDLGH